jgi:hypothetical protein
MKYVVSTDEIIRIVTLHVAEANGIQSGLLHVDAIFDVVVNQDGRSVTLSLEFKAPTESQETGAGSGDNRTDA